jgi:hypothetical protein
VDCEGSGREIILEFFCSNSQEGLKKITEYLNANILAEVEI